MKEFQLGFGCETWELKFSEDQVVEEFLPNLKVTPAKVMDLVCNALANPVGYPELKRAITPDDRLAIVMVDKFNRFFEILVSVLRYVLDAGVAMENVTIVCLAEADSDSWVENLPDEYNEIKIEIHNPDNKKSHAFLTSDDDIGKLYLNRTIIEADQIIVLGKRQFDPVFGISGAESDLYPTFANSEMIASFSKTNISDSAPGSSMAMQQAVKVSWLLGAPYFIQVIEGANQSVEEIIVGASEANRFAEKKLNEIWKRETLKTYEIVIALVGGPGEKIGFAQLCRAVGCAKRIVKKNGVVVLLAKADLDLEVIKKQLDIKASGKNEIASSRVSPHLIRQWVEAASENKVFVSTFEGGGDVGRLLAKPLHSTGELSKLLSGGKEIAIIRDAHKARIEIRKR